MYEGVVQDLIDELGRLPGVGPKSAQRIAFHLLAAEPADVRRLVSALTEVKDKVRFCSTCGNVAEEEECRICRDPRRDRAAICVVEEPKDVLAVERTREFRGRYHVLGGALDPLSGVGPDQLRIKELLARIGADEVSDGLLEHLHIRDTTLAYVSRAPLEKLEAWKAKKGWRFPWYSSYGTDFNYDFGVTIDASKGVEAYSYRAIADELVIAVDTVKGTLSQLFERFEISDDVPQNQKRAVLARRAVAAGLVRPGS